MNDPTLSPDKLDWHLNRVCFDKFTDGEKTNSVAAIQASHAALRELVEDAEARCTQACYEKMRGEGCIYACEVYRNEREIMWVCSRGKLATLREKPPCPPDFQGCPQLKEARE